jgi:hypothetical protein
MRKQGSLLLIGLFMAVLALGQSASVTLDPTYVKFDKDFPPDLLITSPSSIQQNKSRGVAKVQGTSITIKGKVTDKNGLKMLLINNFGVQVGPDGSFSQTVVLNKGDNVLNFKVTDQINNTFEQSYTVNSDGTDNTVPTPEPAVASKYVALLIGINEYEDPEIVDLDRPVADAKSLAEILVNDYTFESENVQLLENPTRADIIDALDNLRKTMTPNDNLLLFYAGHGLWEEEGEIGYWIPSDGTRRSTAGYFRNSTLTDMIGAIKSKHTLLLADACFSGAIFKSRRAFFDADVAVNKLYELPSRKAMTSGTLTEVPDRSAFLEYMTKRLKGNSEKYLSAAKLFSSIREVVINNSDVIPQYGTIQKVGDEGGEFIFIRRD